MTAQETFVANGAESTLSASLGASTTTVNVTDTAPFPSVPFYATIDPAEDAKREVVLVTAIGSGTFTATRGRDGTSGVEHNEGAVVACVPVAAHWTDINDRVDEAEADISTNASDISTLESGKLDTSDHTKATHDALGIDADTVDGVHASGFLAVGEVVGAVVPFAGSVAPSRWLLCDGSAVSRTTYADLFAVVGTTYGAGDGSTTFVLPDLRDRFPVGAGTSYARGDTGGEAEHALTTAEMPSHAHSGPSHTHGDGTLSTNSDSHSHTAQSSGGHSHDYKDGQAHAFANNDAGGGGTTHSSSHYGAYPSGNTATSSSSGSHTHSTTSDSHSHDVTGSTAASGTGNTGSAGSGNAHENRPPYLALNFIIFAGA